MHGGGKEIDAALARAGIAKRQVDGLRVTDAATLDVVVAVLAGAVNTRLVAAVNKAGGRAVGLTGADARARAGDAGGAASSGGRTDGRSRPRRRAERQGPAGARGGPARGWIRAGRGVHRRGRDGQLYNVNADTLAADLAARLGASGW